MNDATQFFDTTAGGPGYEIERSLRFNSADSAYLNRTPSVAGNRKTWTWAGWVKRAKPGQSIYLTLVQGGSTYPYEIIYFDNTDKLVHIHDNNSFAYQRRTLGVFRDPSAWYHIVFAADTTQATASNRLKIYVNGLQQDTESLLTGDMPLNFEGSFNSTTAAYTNGQGIGNFYLADNYFIDGQALDPTSFGEFDTNNVWQPKAYAGTYGTNGFHLPFSDNSTAAALGTDTSGNGNTWTVNNLSVTAGAGNDSLVDSPTNYGEDTGAGGEVRGNYATLNPLDKGAGVTLSNGNLDGSASSDANYRATISINSGKHYWEVSNFNTAASSTYGILEANLPVTTLNLGEILYRTDGLIITGGSSIGSYASLSSGDILGIACNFDAGEITFYKNNSLQATVSFTSNMTTYGVTPFGRWNNGSGATYNFGQRPFAYTAPSGFKALCTTNLPEPTIADGSTAMDVVTYTGNGSTQTISGLNFSPDLVWIKNRSNATGYFHALMDTIRGNTKILSSNSTTAEDTRTAQLTSFDSNGFSLGNNSDGGNYVNLSGDAYVAWTWDAGSSTVTNTDGSISSQVRANPGAGFSVVTYTASGTAGATVGHGLGVAPELIIVKNRDYVQNWFAYHQYIGGAGGLNLNTTQAAFVSDAGYWNSTNPSSSVITLGNYHGAFGTHGYVAYCFAPVAGYSSFGSYTGNGSADGPFVYTGFKSRWILLKKSDTTENWILYDTARNTSNVTDDLLIPNSSQAEAVDDVTKIDIISNGFKVRSSGNGNNASGGTYIYCAFAESPFQYARAR